MQLKMKSRGLPTMMSLSQIHSSLWNPMLHNFWEGIFVRNHPNLCSKFSQRPSSDADGDIKHCAPSLTVNILSNLKSY